MTRLPSRERPYLRDSERSCRTTEARPARFAFTRRSTTMTRAASHLVCAVPTAGPSGLRFVALGKRPCGCALLDDPTLPCLLAAPFGDCPCAQAIHPPAAG